MTEPDVILDDLQPADFAAALALWNSTPGVRANESPAEFARILARNPGLPVAARLGSELVGAVLAGHDGRRGYLYHLAVAEHCRRQGLGRKLVARCLERLQQAGIRRVTIFSIVDNSAGEAFWLRCGWRLRDDLKALSIDLPMNQP